MLTFNEYNNHSDINKNIFEYAIFMSTFEQIESQLNESTFDDQFYQDYLDEALNLSKTLKKLGDITTNALGKVGLSAHKAESGIFEKLWKAGKWVGKAIYLATKVSFGDQTKEEELKTILATKVTKEQIMDFIFQLDNATLHILSAPLHTIGAITGIHIEANLKHAKKVLGDIDDTVRHSISAIKDHLLSLDASKSVKTKVGFVLKSLSSLVPVFKVTN